MSCPTSWRLPSFRACWPSFFITERCPARLHRSPRSPRWPTPSPRHSSLQRLRRGDSTNRFTRHSSSAPRCYWGSSSSSTGPRRRLHLWSTRPSSSRASAPRKAVTSAQPTSDSTPKLLCTHAEAVHDRREGVALLQPLFAESLGKVGSEGGYVSRSAGQ